MQAINKVNSTDDNILSWLFGLQIVFLIDRLRWRLQVELVPRFDPFDVGVVGYTGHCPFVEVGPILRVDQDDGMGPGAVVGANFNVD